MLDSGADLATAQALMGHANPATTARYDRRPAATRRAAMARLHLPRPEDRRRWNRIRRGPGSKTGKHSPR
ncbi:hypothetical protein ACU635_33305 [[Actinomadura] parvosata]|uniref:hypothetical protein n=1 Tax=[Actinomadura] parvosata TaxID=1955412 RepID=UPI00406CCC9F